MIVEPTESCMAVPTANHLLRWCITLGVPEVWVSDTALQFENRVMKTLEGALQVENRFAVANSPWSNGICEQMMRGVVHALKVNLQKESRDIREWVDVVPAVQCALNTGDREKCASTPYHVMFGWAPLTSLSTLALSTGEDWKVDILDKETLRRKVANVVEAQQGLHKVVKERVNRNRDRQRQAASRGQLPNFAVGDHVMMTRVRRPGSTPTLVTTWTGLSPIVTAGKVHVYGVQNIVTAKLRTCIWYASRFYADKDLEITAALKEVFQDAFI